MPDELIAPPGDGRVFDLSARPGLADCAPSGRARLDAIARWMQDVAYADVEDAGLQDAAVWVVRRTRIKVERFPRFGERLAVRTFCSGIGRMWAERRTSIVEQGAEHDGAGPIEAVSLWVHLDPVERRPTRLTHQELAVYGGAAADRQVSARLRHPVVDPAVAGEPWTFRAAECDLADHINNAAYWLPLEDELLSGGEPERIDVEIEFRTPAQPGVKRIVAAGEHRWITDGDGDVHASVRINSRA